MGRDNLSLPSIYSTTVRLQIYKYETLKNAVDNRGRE
jgi:hypothetical protein